jgi:hypothetical protein
MSQRIQRCTISGYLYGIICPEFKIYDRVGDAEIYAVRSSQKEPTANPTEAERGDAKRVIRTVSEDELKRAAGQNVIEGRTDERGFFCLNDDKYKGELLDIYVCLNAVPLAGEKPEQRKLDARVCLFLGTYAPRRATDSWFLRLYIPQSIWCALKRKADVWTVAGRVATCDTDQPLGNVTVIARDVDITQNDLLGSAVTNPVGIFRIDYPGDNFRQGTIVDVELFGGPDIYFEIRDSNGNPLLTEDPSLGRKPGRCDSGPCKCVRLCVDLPNGHHGDGDLPSAWISVGTDFVIPDSTVALNDFDADGHVGGAAKFVITGAPAMMGGVPHETATSPRIEYRFLVGDTTAPNNAAALDASHFTRIVGVGADQNLFVDKVLMGRPFRVVSFSPFETETVNIRARQTDLSAEGWLDINTVMENRFIAAGRDPADIALFSWIPRNVLMNINTVALPKAPDVPDGAAGPGDAVPAGSRIPLERMSLRFETREVTTHAPMIGNGKVLNRMIVNNNPIFLKVAMREHLDSGDFCGILHGLPHIAYTAYHPYLQSVSLNVRSNSGAYNNDQSDPPQGLPLSGNTNDAIVNLNNPALEIQPHLTTRCTYIVTLGAGSRLHTGEGQVPGVNAPVIAFYWEP